MLPDDFSTKPMIPFPRRSFFKMLAASSAGLAVARKNYAAPAAVSPATAPGPDLWLALPARGLCAHRGAMDTHPENTIPSFQEAIQAGAHMIELDVQLSADGVAVLMHDDTVDRTTDGHGAVASLTFAQLHALDAGVK